MATLNAASKREARDKKFFAALQGVDLDDDSSKQENDIVQVKGFMANQEGFGIGLGLGHVMEG